MTDIVKFLTARLADDEAYAVEAAEEFGPDWIEIWSGQIDLSANLPERQPPDNRCWDAHVQTNDSRVSRYMVRHDPAHVLREVKAKRAIMEAHACVWLVDQWVEVAPGQRRRGELRVCRSCEPVSGFMTDQWPCLTLKLLAAPYAEHADYKQEWPPDA